jgi:hypothetical protein
MRRPPRRRALSLAAAVVALAAGPATARAAELSGPPGTSLDKVLVIGTDGTRWDLLDAAMRSGRAPALARLRREGFGRPSLLEYAPMPTTLTISEVGWSSIASGVWEDKHGIDGSAFNRDPGQATKNGYADFLTRIERRRPQTSTFLASDWDNIGLAENGGPIFGSAMDANFAARVREETIAAWDRGDEQVTRAAARYLRRGDPDAGFVYLGLVDETAHLAGSATPAYARSITVTDRRIGRLLRAIRSRPSYAFESWTVLVTTDHGQRPLTEPSAASHLTDTPLERTSFVLGAGPGLAGAVPRPRVVDVLPTVLHQLGLRTPRAWGIDGRTLSRAAPPSRGSATLRRGRLAVRYRLGSAPRVSTAVLRLPAWTRLAGPVRARVNGRRAVVAQGRRSVVVRVGGRRLSRLVVTTARGGVWVDPGVKPARSPRASLTLRHGGRTVGVLRTRLTGL